VCVGVVGLEDVEEAMSVGVMKDYKLRFLGIHPLKTKRAKKNNRIEHSFSVTSSTVEMIFLILLVTALYLPGPNLWPRSAPHGQVLCITSHQSQPTLRF
jgi:hypothetical protein